MKFGLSLMGLSLRYWPEITQLAESRGFESVWVPEHVVFPTEMPASYRYSPDGFPPVRPEYPLYDSLILLGWIAATTERIRLGTNIYLLPLRHPIASARAVVTLDRISQGRVVLGVGVGWLEEEFAALDQSFHDRGRRMDEIVPLLRRLWSEDTIEHAGKHFRFGPVTFEPKPKSPPPIEIGGASRAALRRAGRLGDGWIEIGATSLEDLRANLAVVHSARAAAGREQLPFDVTMTSHLADDVEQTRRAASIGVTRIIAGRRPEDGRPTVDDYRRFVEEFADNVIEEL